MQGTVWAAICFIIWIDKEEPIWYEPLSLLVVALILSAILRLVYHVPLANAFGASLLGDFLIFTIYDFLVAATTTYSPVFFPSGSFIRRHMDDEVLEFNSSLSHFEEKLGEAFWRCHRSFLVNRSRISNVWLKENMVEFDNGESCLLSRKAKAEYASALQRK